MFLRIFSLILIIPGIITIYASRYIVKKYQLDKKVTVEDDGETDEEEMDKYRFSKAQLNVKMLGMLISLPGLILFIIAFK